MSKGQVLPRRRCLWGALALVASTLSGCSLADDAPQVSSGLLRDSSERTLLSTCIDGQLVAKPGSIDLTCKNPPLTLMDLTWVSWGDDTADATGDASVVVECEGGDCQGMPQLRRLPASVTARKVVDHVAVIDGKPLVRQYSELDVHVTDDSTSGTPKQLTFSLPVVISSTTKETRSSTGVG